MEVSAHAPRQVRTAALTGTVAALTPALTALPARAAEVGRNVLLAPADQPPVGHAWSKPYIDPYFDPSRTGPSCWQYGIATGAQAFEQRWKSRLATCAERDKPGEGPDGSSYVTVIRKVGTADGVDVWRITGGPNPYVGLDSHVQVAVVRQGRAVYAMNLLDYRNGEPAPVPFTAAVVKIKQRLAAYYP
ncbi:hypothetical protein GCM10009678_55480 [Actinomadura kijaniata]|uniref:Uncharacterized protein n=1 Tax=Actinomadura namibiensis TaxID=182080 RepID=A0A7W3LLI4_ACTNM|nr:hypothetical protein [Actinomadura namibiensis]MBA8950235.1 hypothetical protein [Actinomadura namibiensis]